MGKNGWVRVKTSCGYCDFFLLKTQFVGKCKRKKERKKERTKK